MTELEKMMQYIERTKLDKNDRFCLGLNEAFALAEQALTCGDFPLEAISLAFNFGKAKGFRAAKAKAKAKAKVSA